MITRSLWRHPLLIAALLAVAAHAETPPVRSFTARSFADIRTAYARRPVVVSFWSVNCEPCQREMALIERLHRAYPAVDIVLVAADAPELRAAVLRQLSRHDLAKAEAWQFDDEPEERLRYSVDRTWRGELPRTYFIDTAGHAITHTGIPDESWLTDWFARANDADATRSRASPPTASH